MIPELGGGDEMEEQRLKNNLAVRRSRLKSRQKMSYMVDRWVVLGFNCSLFTRLPDSRLGGFPEQGSSPEPLTTGESLRCLTMAVGASIKSPPLKKAPTIMIGWTCRCAGKLS